MYDELLEFSEQAQYKNAQQGPNLDLLQRLEPYEELAAFEKSLHERGEITFKNVFHEPVGYYLMKCFLISDYSVDKAIFVSDVELYKTLVDPTARLTVSKKVFDRFCKLTDNPKQSGESVFRNNVSIKPGRRKKTMTRHNAEEDQAEKDHAAFNLAMGKANTIGVYGPSITKVRDLIEMRMAPKNIFDEICQQVLDDLRMDVFPRFCKHELYKKYIQCKQLEDRPVTYDDFKTLRVLGRGAFGFVNAVVKKDSGKLYAMKCINKKRVMATKSQKTIMAERNFLADMNSSFVTCLKYAVMDDEYLYFCLDLMSGGDLKYHLNRDKTFSEARSKFYAAEVLLGLEHIHSQNIIYRDMKLENILLDERGHCRISDLGLSVRTKDKVKGYAGTPGYVAPEVILKQPYDKMADFFAYGVMIYRFISGKKPFAVSQRQREEERRAYRREHEEHGKYRSPSQRSKSLKLFGLDKNVVEIEPDYPERYFSIVAKKFLQALLQKDPNRRLGYNGIKEIKEHTWFEDIDFGLLEAGYLEPPEKPDLDELNSDSRHRVGPPPGDEKYAKVRITKEFEKTLDPFPFMSRKSQQEEMVECLQRADEGINWEKFAPESERKPLSERGREASPAASGAERGKKKKKKCIIM